MSRARTPSPSRGRSLARGLGGVLVLALLGGGLWYWQRGPKAEPNSQGTAADSTQVAIADTTAADSAAVRPKKGGGIFGFLRRGDRNEQDGKQKDDPVPVELASVRTEDVPSYFTGTATVEAERRADVLAKVSGTVDRLLVEEGDDVRAGQVLLELDAKEQLARLEELGVRARNLERQFDRTKSLHNKNLASDREFEDTKLEMEAAQAQEHVGKITLGYYQVKAPFEGKITLRQVNVGQHVTVGLHLFSIADLDPLLARIFMPEKQVDRVHPAQEVRIVPDARPNELYSGIVDRIAPIVDPRSGTVKVTIAIHGQHERLRPGSFVRAQIKTDVHANALVIPKQALVSEGGETYVYRAVADSVAKVRIETGFTDDKTVEIVLGLDSNDQVVTVGQGGLRHGTRIRDLLASEHETAQARTDPAAVPAPPDSDSVVTR